MAAAAPPPPFVPRTVALSYDVAELDALCATHFAECDVVGFGARPLSSPAALHAYRGGACA